MWHRRPTLSTSVVIAAAQSSGRAEIDSVSSEESRIALLAGNASSGRQAMSCPPEIAAVVLELMETGLLRIRSLGWSGQADRCAIEAAHIHNLPGLLTDDSRERL